MGDDNRSPQIEAIIILQNVNNDLTSPDRDLKIIFRKCQHTCEILGWENTKTWFQQELNGYPTDQSLPSYRRILGKRLWEITGSIYDISNWESRVMVNGVDPGIFEEETDILEVRAGITWIINASQTGYRELLTDTKIIESPFDKKNITFRRVRVFSGHAIAESLSQVEKVIFDFVSKTYVQLKYSNMIRSIWEDYQTHVAEAISQLNLTNHLSVIESNLQSKNPEAARLTSFECRNMLNDLANFLWRDKRTRYEFLPGKTVDGKLDVSNGKSGNRLVAYLHQKGVTGTQGKYFREEISHISSVIQSLISYQSEAHEPITDTDARSVAIATFILIGEVVNRTDLIPIETYISPMNSE